MPKPPAMLRPVAVATLLLAGSAGAALAATVTVRAAFNSSNLGQGAATGLVLSTGDAFTVTADPLDTWSLGPEQPCTRTTNADGLDPACYGQLTQGGLTADYGTLVGQIGVGGEFFVIGTDFEGTADASGELFLYAWDSFARDNRGSILAIVAAVPLPASAALLLGGLLGLAALRRRAA